MSIVVNGYVRLFGLPRKNYWSSHSGSFILSVFKTIFICIRILFDSHKIYHLHTAEKGSILRKFAISSFIRLKRKKYVVHLHGSGFKSWTSKSKFGEKLAKNLLQNSAAIISITEDMKIFLVEKIQIKNNIFIIPNFCETILEKPVDLAHHKEPIKIIFAGIYGQRKGIYDLLTAFEKANFDVPVQLDLHGNGEVEKVREIVGKSTRKDLIAVNDWIEHSEYLKKLPNYDFLVLPSYAETFGLSLVEAMGIGIPVISTFAGAIPEIVKNEETGLLINAGDILKLTLTIEKLVNNKSLREKLGKNAWVDVKNRFSPQIVLKKLEEMYERI
jgi:glycosyltransferase involved in cell wall biosynthesis